MLKGIQEIVDLGKYYKDWYNVYSSQLEFSELKHYADYLHILYDKDISQEDLAQLIMGVQYYRQDFGNIIEVESNYAST